MPDLSKFLPLVDLIGRAGPETSEFKAARTAGYGALAIFLLGIAAVVVDCASQAFQGTHLGVWLGAIGAIVAGVLGILQQGGYANGRVALKSKVADVLKAVELSAHATEVALASLPDAPPAPIVLPAPASTLPAQLAALAGQGVGGGK